MMSTPISWKAEWQRPCPLARIRQSPCRISFSRSLHHVAAQRRPQRCIARCEERLEALTEDIQTGLDAQAEKDKRIKLEAQRFREYNERLKALSKKLDKGLQGTSIYLVGMMGSGKSTVGKLVAAALKYPFFDTDELIEQCVDLKISEIFEQEGEDYFRDIETATLKEIMSYKSSVVSTGGGAVLRRLNWGYMQHGIVIWLQGPPELLARRALKDDAGQRPKLKSDIDPQSQSEEERYKDIRTKLTTILNEREGKYAQADINVSLADSKSQDGQASAALVAYRVLKAIDDRIESDRKKAPGKEFKGFGKAPSKA